MTTVTHLAAPHVTVSGRTVQRCCVCGEKLLDSRGVSAPLGPDGKVPEYPVWRTGSYVRITAGNPRSESLEGHWDTDELPGDFCLPLVE